MDDGLAQLYEHRFGGSEASRLRLWETLVSAHFQQFVHPSDVVLDLGAGYCEFINAVDCARKIAVDLNPAVKERAGDDVEVHHCSSTNLPDRLAGEVDVVWVSNFFEHLADSAELIATLTEIHRVLRPDGRLMILQPNIRLTKEAYWDFVDHSLPITEKSLAEAVAMTGFIVEQVKVRFLPYTTRSRLPISPRLIRMYLRLPPAKFLLGKQTFMVARRS